MLHLLVCLKLQHATVHITHCNCVAYTRNHPADWSVLLQADWSVLCYATKLQCVTCTAARLNFVVW